MRLWGGGGELPLVDRTLTREILTSTPTFIQRVSEKLLKMGKTNYMAFSTV